MRQKLVGLKAELQGPTPTPVERLLADRVGVCWLQVHQLDVQSATGEAATPSPQGLLAQKRLESANRRYLLAIKQLATVRKLLRPDLPKVRIDAYAAGHPKPGRGRPPKRPPGPQQRDVIDDVACQDTKTNPENGTSQ